MEDGYCCRRRDSDGQIVRRRKKERDLEKRAGSAGCWKPAEQCEVIGEAVNDRNQEQRRTRDKVHTHIHTHIPYQLM